MQNKTLTIKEKVESILDDIHTRGANAVGITDEMVGYIKSKGELKELVLTNSTVTPLALKALLEGFSNVMEVNFTGTKIPSSSLDDLIRFISTNGSLKRVTLEDCGMSPEELIMVAKAVQHSLERLDVSDNSMLTTRGKVAPNESHIVAMVRILKDHKVVLYASQSGSSISPSTQKYLTLCKEASGIECNVFIKMEILSRLEEQSCLSKISLVNKVASRCEKLSAEHAGQVSLNLTDFQAFRMAGVLDFLEVALVVQAGMSKDQAKCVRSSVKSQLDKLSNEVNANIAFANRVAEKCANTSFGGYAPNNNVGLSLQGFDRLRKCEDLVRNALKLQHGFSDEFIEDQIKSLKKQASELVKQEQAKQLAAEEAKRNAEKAREVAKNDKSNYRNKGDKTTKAKSSLGEHVSISRNR